MDKRNLLEHLRRLAQASTADGAVALEQRKRDELEFHNRIRDEAARKDLSDRKLQELHGNSRYYRTVRKSNAFVDDWIARNSPGRVLLDYACGNAHNALKAARAGAELSIGLDLSDVSIHNARELARSQGLEQGTFFLQGDCESTGLPDGCIDVCICSGMLHHLDLSYALPELRRILSPGGVVLAVEALAYNPFIRLYRALTPEMRTEWERKHILSMKDVAFARRFFEVNDIRHWHLFSIAGAFFPSAMGLLDAVDAAILRVPGIKMMSWMFTFEMRKPIG
ncbi:MAG: methyltransferase domain-containing protein [Acidobacteriota bacterium]